MSTVSSYQTGALSVPKSAAIAQMSMAPARHRYPLFPVLTEGCPLASTTDIQFPLEIEFALNRVSSDDFRGMASKQDRYASLLTPVVAELYLGEGYTPLVSADRALGRSNSSRQQIYIKDESQNPTGSHKDRLNRLTVSAAVLSNSPGIVVSSSGNHGVSAAAYAARAGLPCILITMPGICPIYMRMANAYGAAAVAVPAEMRWPLMRQVVAELGFHPVSNVTTCHTGHPFGPEGYKPISYEIAATLGCAPTAVFVPTGYAELLFGIHKGFVELRALDLIDTVPQLFSVEPAARGPLALAMRTGADIGCVEALPTDAAAIACTVSSYRGVVALRDSGGRALTVTDDALRAAQSAMSRSGIYPELSAAAGLAALKQLLAEDHAFDGPVVVVQTGGGVKDPESSDVSIPVIDPTWPALRTVLSERYGIRVCS
jgi:threonine synthase